MCVIFKRPAALLKPVLLFLWITAYAVLPVFSQQEFDGIRGTRHWMRFSDAPNALYHHLARQAYGFLEKRSREVAAIGSLEEWKKRQQWIRQELNRVVGPFPPKTALNPVITKVVQKDDYRIENVVYESQPRFYVTASLFIPSVLKNGKAPAIIYCSGHSESGYRAYQNILVNLVRKGFIVLAFDPAGQGERLQYYDPATGKSRFQYPSYEHSYAGAQVFMTGRSLASYFIWDGIRAVDYLLTRKEVDTGRIGITGRSGGGTQSAFIAAFDDRIKASAPENYFTNFTRLYQSMGPQDAEQNFTGAIAHGLDMADLLLVRAPKPTLMLTTSRDMFPVQGAIETAGEVARLYRAYGRDRNFRRVSDDAPHASTKKNREAMYAFFQKYLDNPGDPTDEKVPPLKDALQVTETGQLSTSLKGATVFSLNKLTAEKEAAQLEKKRRNGNGNFADRIRSAKILSGYRPPMETDTPVFTGRVQRQGYVMEKYFVKGEGAYVIPYLLLKPDAATGKALIFLSPSGKIDGSGEGGEMEWFVRKGFTVLAPDLIGTGEMGPGIFKGDSYIDSVSYNSWFSALLIGRSIVGIRAADVVKLTALLKKADFGEVYGLAKGAMEPVLLHAAAFDRNIGGVALTGHCPSYRALVMKEDYDPAFLQNAVPGSMGVYDLPDLAASLFPRKLLLAGVGAEGDPAFGQDLSVIKAAYGKDRDLKKLQVVPGDVLKEQAAAWERWIGD
ncbi:alpha/beta hydrolase family protein [Niabella aurantiaca]|uniref:alpha/beta hydrolase family protein n=1 Tax=Niabella aurantiaca TaxID=379900 RepID=UPI00037F6E05|nr:alpha/beta hydrolase family protein [Niabella aurantiaca]